MAVPYVHSGYDRIKDDNYQTIDKRCVYGLLEWICPNGTFVDVCAPSGSGIVDTLTECGVSASGVADAMTNDLPPCSWIVTNPPYSRPLVDNIIRRQIKRVADNEVYGLAVLLRSNFDFAKSRHDMFNTKLYTAQIRLRFRPWWSEERVAQPIHNYVWHIWTNSSNYLFPGVFYSDGVPGKTQMNKFF